MGANAAQNKSPVLIPGASGLFVFFWASGFVAAKFGLPYAEPFTFLALRFVLALIVLLPLTAIWRVRWPTTPVLIAHLVVVGLMIQTLYLGGVYYAIEWGISTGVIALIVGLQPLITGALAGPALGEKVTMRQWLGLGLGFLGLGMVVAEKVDFSSGQALGTALGALSLFSITIGTIYQKRFCAEVDIRAAVTIQNAASCAVIMVLAISVETMTIDWTIEFIFAVLWSALCLSVVAIALYYFLIRRGAAARVTSLMYLSPPITALMGWLMFNEIFPPLALFGMGIAVIGVAMANR